MRHDRTESIHERDVDPARFPRSALRKLRNQGVLEKNRHWFRAADGIVITPEGVDFLNNHADFARERAGVAAGPSESQKAHIIKISTLRRERADLRIRRILSARDKFLLAQRVDGAGPELVVRLQSTEFLTVGSVLRSCIQGDDPRTWYYQGKLPKRRNQKI